MNLFSLLLNGAILLLCLIFLRHSYRRVLYFLQMLQQHGYKTHEYRRWILDNFSSKVVTTEHLLINTVILAFIYFLSTTITFTAAVIVMFVFTLFWFGGVSRYKSKKEKKPLVFTPRVIRLTVTLAVILIPIYYFFFNFSFSSDLLYITPNIQEPVGNYLTADPYFLTFLLALADILIPFLIFPAAWLMKPVESSIQKGFKRQAKKKIASMPNLKVIAITGSYGKTSTKFAMHTLLKERFRVCVTPGSYNTPMGICKVINNDLDSRDQVLILEMGARYEGNIKELCELAQPDISVITNVGISHLETFGSQEAVAREKSTLARELKPGGTLILNGEDPIVKEMGRERSDIKKVFVGENGNLRAKDITVNENGTRFLMEWMSENGSVEQSTTVETKLLGAHNVQNLLLSAAVAREFDMRIETIAVAASNMEPVEHRLELKKQGDLTVIDDAFNSNPVGAKNAVEILGSFSTGRRIIITPGMIELGEEEEAENRKFGEHIAAANLDLVLLVGKNRTEPIYDGILSHQNGREMDVRVAKTLFEANEILQEYAKPGDIVLYENDLPDSYNE